MEPIEERLGKQAEALELGMLGLAALVVVGLLVLLLGGGLGEILQRGRHNEPPPERGSVPGSRHQNTSATSAR